MDFGKASNTKDIFDKAANFVKSIAGKLDKETLLALYARFKQANVGPCNTSKPGFFDFEGKQKWEAWKKLGTMEKEDAMEEYIDIVGRVEPDWEHKIDSGEIKQSSALGVAVSTMANTEPVISDGEKSLFDWCKEGNAEQVIKTLNTVNINQPDEEGMCLLHWACDRGHSEVITRLLDHGAQINLQDKDGQTALHYAASCGYLDIVQLLLSRDCDPSITDNDGTTAAECSDNSKIQEILNNSAT